MFDLIPYGRKNRGAELTPYDEFKKMFGFMDNLFDSAFTSGLTYNSIRADIRESEKEYKVEAELPGAKKEDIKIDFKDNTLLISVEHKEENEEKNDNFIRRERRYGSASRGFLLENVNEEEIKAKFEDGILKVILPKEKPEIQKQTRIEIE
ncbi:MAG: Hsp20/alpha crystallin family protein [Deltaproteobacteria bacterium]